jgi:hypothetical protein
MDEREQFFPDRKTTMMLVDFQPRLSKASEKRVLMKFSVPLDAETVDAAPINIKEGFYANSKDGLGLNPIGIEAEFADAIVNFYATPETATPSLKVSGCTLRKLQIIHPEGKGDVEEARLTFTMHVPASEKVIVWCYKNYGCDVAAEFAEVQLSIPAAKEDKAEPEQDDKQLKLVDQPAPTEEPAKKSKKKAKVS